MEMPLMDHVRHSLMIDRNKDVIIDKLLNLTLEIICLLTGEDYVVVRKSGDQCASEKRGRRVSDKCSEAQSLVTGGSLPTPVTEENPARRIQGPAKNHHSDTKELPIKSEDADVSAWDYAAEQKDVVVVSGPEWRSAAGNSAPIPVTILEPSVAGHQDPTDPKASYIPAAHSTEGRHRKCRTPLGSQECIAQEHQAEPPGDGMLHQECKEEEDAAIPGDDDSGEDDSTDLQERCQNPASSEDFIEEDNEMISQEYPSDVYDGLIHRPCKEEAGPDYINSGPAGSSLTAVVIGHYSQTEDRFPNPSDPAVCQKPPSAHPLFFCSICGVDFSSETAFAAHQRLHTEEKSYDCAYCGKSFNQRSRLLSHKRKHTGEKPFSCPVCGRCFAERSALVTHQRIHSGEKPFNCKECARSFVQRSSLVKHQRIHTGERPFVCSQCGRCFSQSSNLVRHQRILHQFL
ncbi:oocyte zinc finger protein XlCOF7.1-like [Bufo bufo]|uniref:oocyte zinc finger protein XlCOF7.1-like n=1 Tax=Bufo bufo TaxID=8384 RepID=UPI001ABECBF5|nr:oocyte zinc finger protein XlCOF7.1-like [Bufo bufo]